MKTDANAAATFLIDGRAPRLGEVFRNPDLARSLELIAKDGRDGFYKGGIAQRIVATELKLGGVMSAEDLAGFSSEWVEPISTTYRGWTVYEIPPNGQGIAALMMLNMMETFPVAKYGHNSADALHAMIEAKKLAYADMYRYVADQKFSRVPVSGMLSKEYAARRAKLIDMAKANCDVSAGEPEFPTKGDTTYLTVVDRDGNMVSLIQSNFSEFGSGIVPEGTGFVLQNRGALFSLDPCVTECAGGAQAAFAHDYSGIHGARRRADCVWNYGRVQSGAGARAVCGERGGFWDEHSSCARGGAIFETYVCGMRCGDGRSR